MLISLPCYAQRGALLISPPCATLLSVAGLLAFPLLFPFHCWVIPHPLHCCPSLPTLITRFTVGHTPGCGPRVPLFHHFLDILARTNTLCATALVYQECITPWRIAGVRSTSFTSGINLLPTGNSLECHTIPLQKGVLHKRGSECEEVYSRD